MAFGELYPLLVSIRTCPNFPVIGFCMAMALFQESGGGWEVGMTLHFVGVANKEWSGTDN